jgi:hypothetical protein
VTRTSEALSFAISLGDRAPEYRDFEDLPSDCAGERRVVALSIALAIDAVSPKNPHEPSSTRFAVLADGMLATGSDRPSLGGGFDLRAKVTPAFWPGIGFVGLVAKDQPVRDDIPARFDTTLAAVRLEACFVLPVSRSFDVSTCAEGWLGTSNVVARAVDDATSSGQFYSAAALTVELQVRFTRAFGIHVGLDGVLSVRPAHVEVLDSSGTSTVQRDLPRVLAGVRLGPSVYF